MQRDVIRVALTGTSGNACAVVSQNGRALVFFRGGAANWNAVERYLSENGAPELLGLVDLRQDPTQIDFPPGLACWVLEELPSGAASRTLPGVWAVDAWHDSGGNLAVLDAGGYHIAFTAGRAQTPAPVAVDLFCAGASLPDCVQPAAILTNASAARMADWQVQGTLYSGEEPVAVLRPGRSVLLRRQGKLLYSENELKKRLKAGCAVYYFYAGDEALVRAAAAKAEKALAAQDPETTVLEGPTPSVEEIVLAAGTISFFGGKRLVLMPLVRPSAYSDKDLQEFCDTLADTENAVFILTSVMEEKYGKLRPGKREQS